MRALLGREVERYGGDRGVYGGRRVAGLGRRDIEETLQTTRG